MKIYKFALKEEIREEILENAKERPFPSLFGDKMRLVIPLKNEVLLDIVKRLRTGKTNSKTSYKVDIENRVAYRYIVKDEDFKLDPRPMRLGRVIWKELGKEYADQWSIQANSTQGEDYSIILSRDPIDIVRMSDHSGIHSCHSPNEGYFTSAKQEATEGGAIAYLVNNSDLKHFINTNGEDALQSQEVFSDSNRKIKGISPISRLRINRYFDEDDEEKQIAIPLNRIYGNDMIAGFYDTVRQYLYSEQEKFIDFDNINMRDYHRAGGDYSDERDRIIMTKFFGGSMGVTHDLEHSGGETTATMYNEELDKMTTNANNSLAHCSVYAGAEMSDGYLDIYAGGDIKFNIRGRLSEQKDVNEIYRLLGILKKETEIHYKYNIEDIEFRQNKNIVEVILKLDFNNDSGISNPDDAQRKFDDLIVYEEDYYILDYEIVQNFFLSNRTIINDEEIENDIFGNIIKRYAGRNVFYESGMVYININLDFVIKHEFGYGRVEEKENIKKLVADIFNYATKREIRRYIEREDRQEKFNFYKDDLGLKKLINYVPRLNVIFSKNFVEYAWDTVKTKDRKIIITIVESELTSIGIEYCKAFFQVLNNIISEIIKSLRLQYSGEWKQEDINNGQKTKGGETIENKPKDELNITQDTQNIQNNSIKEDIIANKSNNRGINMNWYQMSQFKKQSDQNNILQKSKIGHYITSNI